MKYRISFSRLARDHDEIIENKESQNFFCALLGGRAKNVIDSFHKSLPNGHILDNMIVEDEINLTGLEVLERKIHPIYPEAKIASWGKVD